MGFGQTVIAQQASLGLIGRPTAIPSDRGGSVSILDRIGDVLLGDPATTGGGGGLLAGVGGLLGQFGNIFLQNELAKRQADALSVAPATVARGAAAVITAAKRQLPGVLTGLGAGEAIEAAQAFFGGGNGGAINVNVPLLTPKGNPRKGPIGIVNPQTGECMFVANLGPPSGFKDWSRKRRHHHHPR